MHRLSKPFLLGVLALSFACTPGPADDAGVQDAADVVVIADVTETLDAASLDATPPDAFVPPDEVPAFWDDFDLTLTGPLLVDALHDRLEVAHQRVSFDDLFDRYPDLGGGQPGCENGIADLYSDKCWTPDERCGQYQRQGDCYNREHTWPQSWWGGGGSTSSYSDVFSVVPVDGFVNGQRGNLPYGTVRNIAFQSTNGSKRGPCEEAEAQGDCFEPADEVKGDIARIYFYLAVRYEDEHTCCNEAAVNRADVKAWQETLLRAWHTQDPVSEAERIRHERGFSAQENRNPFIDFPQMVNAIDDF